jgi:hemerythrin superfamily protein
MTQGDVIDVLARDHREIEGWFREYEGTSSAAEKERLATNIIIELVRHAEAEEQFVYPRAKKVIRSGYAVVEREIAQHSEAEAIMNQLDGKKPDDTDFDRLMRKLMRVIREHVKEEEEGWFPQLRRASSAAELRTLADRVEKAKAVSPTRPHPGIPDHPPFNILLGAGAGVVDRARDLVSGRRQR